MISSYGATADPREWAAIARRSLAIDTDQYYVDVEQHLRGDLSLGVQRVALPGLAGLLLVDAKTLDGQILLAEGDSSERQRFTLAHELKHILVDLPAGSLGARDGLVMHPDKAELLGVGMGSSRNDIEATADQFAGEFLVETTTFNRLLKSRRLSVQSIADAAGVFGVSVTAAATKWAAHSEGRSALVEIRSGRVYRFVASARYLAQPKAERWFTVGEAVPQQTRIAAFLKGELLLDLAEPALLSARAWFKGAPAKRLLSEDILEVPITGRLYTLLWYPEDFRS